MSGTFTDTEMREVGRRVDPGQIRRAIEVACLVEERWLLACPPGAHERIRLISLLVRDYFSGRYTQIPYWAVGTIVVTLLAQLEPRDEPGLLPEAALADKTSLMALCLSMLEEELALYRDWCESEPVNGTHQRGPSTKEGKET